MKKIFCYLLLVLGTLSCRNPEEAAVPLHTVRYEMEISPFDKYDGVITYLNEKGKLDSAVTAKSWRYDFQARSGTLLQASVTLKPKNPLEREAGVVYFNIRVDGNVVATSVGLRTELDFKIK